MSTLPRIIGMTPDGDEVELDLAELRVEWEDGLPLIINFEPIDEGKSQISLEVPDGEDDDEEPTHFGMLVVRPGACNVIDLEVETHEADVQHVHTDDCGCDHDH
ncbi:hypothetical protein ACKC9G_08365 [Pokkaliibacter sp. CJK22405]|uniref:hypothetical protein n=1 Tax=Pokkaliibacter sp. CJK22405 TaxID=3384615 RepID=UPI0039856468